jgi:membrane protein DedA with SNARE-associated domain
LSFQELLDSYGYLAIIVGTFLEGETVLILGSIAAQLGYLDLPWVIAAAILGSSSGDQLSFFLGRYKGKQTLERRPGWQKYTRRIFDLLQRHETLVILGFRFVYGIRATAAFVMGMSRVSTVKFVCLETLGATLWGITIGSLGFVFGKAFEVVINDIKNYQMQVLAVLVVLSALAWWFFRHQRRKRRFATIASRPGDE